MHSFRTEKRALIKRKESSDQERKRALIKRKETYIPSKVWRNLHASQGRQTPGLVSWTARRLEPWGGRMEGRKEEEEEEAAAVATEEEADLFKANAVNEEDSKREEEEEEGGRRRFY